MSHKGSSLAMQYNMSKKKSYGGKMCAHGGMPDDCPHCYAEGGDIKGVHTPGEYSSGAGQSRAGRANERAKSFRELSNEFKGFNMPKDALEMSGNAKQSRDLSKADHQNVLNEMRAMPKPKLEAAGGYIEEETEDGYEPMPMKYGNGDEMEGPEYGHEVMGDEEDSGYQKMPKAYSGDIVAKIMHKMSKGGQVANATRIVAPLEENQFDDLVKDGDENPQYHDDEEISTSGEEERRKDIVSRIMKSMKKKDRLPHPA